jgi:hypothetical protein
MSAYALLPRAAANRVYGLAALALARAELSFLNHELLGDALSEPSTNALGGVEYVTFDSPAGPLDAAGLNVVSIHSSAHALFEVCGELLRPVPLTPRAVVDDDITTIQRYVGKTNEQFTTMLVNLTLAAADGAFERMSTGADVRLLDPVCGRGTTLNQAVVYGLDAWGIERSERDFEAYVQFIGRWLKDQRLKHKIVNAKLRRGRDEPAEHASIRYGRDRVALDRRIEVFRDDTVAAGSHIRARSIDLIVADLPYGVQHQNQSGGRASRRPADLLVAALPVWIGLLAAGGAVGLSWNLKTLDRPTMCSLVEDSGLQLCTDPDEAGFSHAVDRAIVRDLIVATKPRP